ncbi:MAG: YqaJ viral recombinase family protein [Mycobacterium sp.]
MLDNPVCGWGDDQAWLAARRFGLSASEVATALGLPPMYQTPWQLWADKTGLLTPKETTDPAALLGHTLEPVLIDQARDLVPDARIVTRTLSRLYRSPMIPWALASPDAVAHCDRGQESWLELVECKTAGLFEPWAGQAWGDQVPYRVEVQARWQMLVTGIRTRVRIIGLITGHGLRMWTIEWDEDDERALFAAAADWWGTHVVNGVEPPLWGRDADTLDALYPPRLGEVADLSECRTAVIEYQKARGLESDAKARKQRAAVVIKRALGGAVAGEVNGQEMVTWAPNIHGRRALKVKGDS